MKNKLIPLCITLVVGIILAGSVLIPVINDATDHTYELSNKFTGSGYYHLADSSPVTFVYDDGTYAINDVTVTPFNANYTTITSDGMTVRWSGGAPTIFSESSNTSVAAFELTANNGTITGTYASSSEPTTPVEVELTYTYLFYQDPNGEYIMTGGIGAPSEVYLLDKSEVYCNGYNPDLGTGSDRWFEFKGNIADGFTFKYGTTEITDVVVNAEKIDGYDDAYALTSFEIEIDEDTTITINRFVAPLTVVATKEHNAAADSLLNVIPVLVIVSLVAMAAGAMILKRDD